MRSEEELERIFNAVQIAILEKCWKGLDEVAQVSLQKSKVDTSEIHRMINIISLKKSKRYIIPTRLNGDCVVKIYRI